jgi:3-deoxy-7-phosphoheptulonate synthase
MLQVGSRNMQNFRLLSAVGEQPTPVLLKRGLMSTIEEMLLAAEYIVGAGNPRVVLCERGIRSFETATRGTLDISAVPVLKERTHLPVVVDPATPLANGLWCRASPWQASPPVPTGSSSKSMTVQTKP